MLSWRLFLNDFSFNKVTSISWNGFFFLSKMIKPWSLLEAFIYRTLVIVYSPLFFKKWGVHSSRLCYSSPLSRSMPRDASSRDASSKWRIVQNARRLRDALFADTTGEDKMVGDTTVGDELTLHKKYYFNKAPRQLAISTLYSVQCTVYSICNVFMKNPWVIFLKLNTPYWFWKERGVGKKIWINLICKTFVRE